MVRRTALLRTSHATRAVSLTKLRGLDHSVRLQIEKRKRDLAFQPRHRQQAAGCARDPAHDVVCPRALGEDGVAPDQIIATRYHDNYSAKGVKAHRLHLSVGSRATQRRGELRLHCAGEVTPGPRKA